MDEHSIYGRRLRRVESIDITIESLTTLFPIDYHSPKDLNRANHFTYIKQRERNNNSSYRQQHVVVDFAVTLLTSSNCTKILSSSATHIDLRIVQVKFNINRINIHQHLKIHTYRPYEFKNSIN